MNWRVLIVGVLIGVMSSTLLNAPPTGSRNFYSLNYGEVRLEEYDPQSLFPQPLFDDVYVNTAKFPFNDIAFQCVLLRIYINASFDAEFVERMGINASFNAVWAILRDSGYYINITDKSLYYNGLKVRNMEVWYSTGSINWEEKLKFVNVFNEFISWINATSPAMTAMPKPFGTIVTELLIGLNWDIILLDITWLYPQIGAGSYDGFSLTRGDD